LTLQESANERYRYRYRPTRGNSARGCPDAGVFLRLFQRSPIELRAYKAWVTGARGDESTTNRGKVENRAADARPRSRHDGRIIRRLDTMLSHLSAGDPRRGGNVADTGGNNLKNSLSPGDSAWRRFDEAFPSFVGSVVLSRANSRVRIYPGISIYTRSRAYGDNGG